MILFLNGEDYGGGVTTLLGGEEILEGTGEMTDERPTATGGTGGMGFLKGGGRRGGGRR